MPRFYRVLGALTVFAVMLLGALPMVIGILTERNHPRAMRGLGWVLDGVSLEQRSFQRGWLGSNSRVLVDVRGGELLTWLVEIQHGPWVGEPGWLSASGTLSHPDYGDVAKLQMLAHLDGHISFNSEIHWADEVNGNVSGRASDRFRDLEIELDDLRLRLAGIAVDGISGSFSRERIRSREGRGNIALHARQLRLGEHHGQGLTVGADWLARGNTLDVAVNLASGEISLPGEQWLASHIELALERVDRIALYALQADLRQAWDEGLRGEVLLARARHSTMLAIPTFLARAPEVRVDALHIQALEGPVVGTARAGLVNFPQAGFMVDIGLLTEVMRLNIDVQLPQAIASRWTHRYVSMQQVTRADPDLLAADSQDLLARMRSNRILIPDGDRYQLSASFADQELIINNQRMLLPTF